MNRQISSEIGQSVARKKEALALATERNEDAEFTTLNRLAGPVDPVEVHRLKTELTSASLGKSFILQVTPCERPFGIAAYGDTAEYTRNFGSLCKYLTLMLRRPVVPIGFAGGLPSYIVRATGKLSFEDVLLRRCPESREPYASSGHLLEIEGTDLVAGDPYSRFLRQVANPIAIRVTPGMTSEKLLTTCALLNPRRQTGKLVLVNRLGEQGDALTALVRDLRRTDVPVVWTFEPTQRLDAGVTHSDVVAELTQAARLLAKEGSRLAGLCLKLPSEEQHGTSFAHVPDRRVAGRDVRRVSSRSPERQYLQLLRLCSELAHAQEVLGGPP